MTDDQEMTSTPHAELLAELMNPNNPKNEREHAAVREIERLQEALAQPEQCQCPNCKVTLHASDCAVHSGPAYPAGKCDCGAQPYDWSECVCPDPKGYLMKCCDCGLVHEAEFGVVRYTSEIEREDCDMVDDPNLQAVFRMRRSEQWSPEDTAHRAGGMPMTEPEQEPVVWMYQDKSTHEVKFQKHMRGFVDHGATYETPLYTTPPQRTWVGLTDEEVVHLKMIGRDLEFVSMTALRRFAKDIEAKLREKNT